MARSGQAPFGYKRDNGRLVIEPDEAKIRRLIYELFIEHQRKKTVAEIINAEGHRTRSGSMFSSQTITRLLNDPKAIGIPGEVHAVISKETFETCQAILRSQKAKGINRKPRHVFAGVTQCECGGAMRVPSKSDKYTCVKCKSKIYAADLEAIFLEQVRLQDNQQLQDIARKWSGLSLDSKISVMGITTKEIIVDSANSKITVTFLDI